jgi:uncharacterized protein
MQTPTSSSERLTHLDTLRGFALLGILLVNFPSFLQPLLETLVNMGPYAETQRSSAELAVQILAQSKFYPLFSMLFGAGFVLILERLENKAVFFYRMFALALIGAVHAIFIWSGDILLSYSIIGMLLALLFARSSALLLTILGVLLLLAAPTVLATVVVVALMVTEAGPDWMMAMFSGESEIALIAEQASIYDQGSYSQAVVLRVQELGMMWAMAWAWLPQVMAFFMLGAALMRSGLLRAPQQHSRFFRLLTGICLPIGLLLCVLAYLPVPESTPELLGLGISMLGGLGFMFGPSILALGYLGALVLLREPLRFLAPAGRMALTLYLMQSLFWTWMFYGYGLGLSMPSPAMQILACLVFFALQLALAHLWLRHYQFGPMEWLWRCLTYRKLLAIKRTGESQ